MKNNQEVPEGYTVIYRRWITLKDGRKLYPPKGKRAWRLVVPRNKVK